MYFLVKVNIQMYWSPFPTHQLVVRHLNFKSTHKNQSMLFCTHFHSAHNILSKHFTIKVEKRRKANSSIFHQTDCFHKLKCLSKNILVWTDRNEVDFMSSKTWNQMVQIKCISKINRNYFVNFHFIQRQ